MTGNRPAVGDVEMVIGIESKAAPAAKNVE
jgi:hypothetical protein